MPESEAEKQAEAADLKSNPENLDSEAVADEQAREAEEGEAV